MFQHHQDPSSHYAMLHLLHLVEDLRRDGVSILLHQLVLLLAQTLPHLRQRRMQRTRACVQNKNLGQPAVHLDYAAEWQQQRTWLCWCCRLLLVLHAGWQQCNHSST